MENINGVTRTIEGAGFTWLGIIIGIIILAGIIIGFNRGLVRELVSLGIVFLTIALVGFLNPHLNSFLREKTPIESKLQEEAGNLVRDTLGTNTVMTAGNQNELIKQLGLPDFLTNMLINNNNAEGYKILDVSSFIDYISKFLANTILNGLSFLITFTLVSVLLRLVIKVFDLFTQLPVIHGFNKAGGAIFGGAKYLIFIWIAMLVMTIFCNTSPGKAVLDMIEQDRILKLLYSWNPLIKYFINVF